MTGDDFISVARELAQHTTEAHARSAVSRAYFGAFHSVRDWLARSGFRVARNDSVHSMIARWLENCGEPIAEEVGRRLVVLRRERNHADYDITERQFGTLQFARVNVESACFVVATLAKCSAEPARSAIIAGIKAYQAKTAPP